MDSDTDSSKSGSDSEADSDTESVIAVHKIAHQRNVKIKLFVALHSILSLEGDSFLQTFSLREGNKHRDRCQILQWAAELDDKMFTRQFRLCREDFFYVLAKIQPDLKKDTTKACNSSGSSICPQLMLMITLRILAGASYLDMIHYRVNVDSVASIVWDTVLSIHKRVDNIKLAANDAECLQLARGWAAIQLRRWGSHLTAGTLYAGDGLAIEIAQPSVADLRERPLSIFRNRKGFWALIAQGFCDCNARFGVFDIKWPGGTNDIIAYQMTEIYHRAVTDGFPLWATFVLDEAYSSCGGMHLTPYSLNRLTKAHRTDFAMYKKMLAFNNVLSSQRITIERAFGILVRRWGILWRPISYSLSKSAKIARVCAMLHNVCVDRWLLNNRSGYEGGHEREHLKLSDVPDQVGVDDPMPADDEILSRLLNDYVVAVRASSDNSLRMKLTDDIYDAGIVTHVDTEFHQMTAN